MNRAKLWVVVSNQAREAGDDNTSPQRKLGVTYPRTHKAREAGGDRFRWKPNLRAGYDLAKTMSGTYTLLLTHLIFSTKNRDRLIAPEIKPELHAYLGGLTRDLKGKPYSINGTDDHVHMLISLPPAISLSDAVRFIKSNSSGWIHDKWSHCRSFAWQLGYGAFSVSKSSVHDVVQYIHGQEEHHRKTTFQEEFISFLKKHEVDYDPRYIWD